METWKLLVWTAGVLAFFGVVVTVGNIPLSGPTAVVVLVVVAIASVVLYALSRHGYRFGHRLGEQMTEDD
ncbi:hypothetical protein HLRTI_001680 [Halorhabdus tiamatea SARL4B]|uniref:Uncharacterized protein n=1 Tax=Halorhabdus tiamatea SARL4B TaxID=1033806 RepID=S6D0W8_9EURY|nr:hypothetical protein [Halorhabdus tiamatea]ERJ06201.1 hypothetical protein HLRTI_001680 [Halorhabdus tiamatea SARL4B]CCQ33763.1 hypothetical protein HTIA_1636 [Halorhabdus tiamatea SARL4B]